VTAISDGRRGDVYASDCPTRVVLDHVTSRWATLVLGMLLDGTMRFSELRRAIGGVSEKMLAQTLQALERDGLVLREVRPVIPPHVDYSLTELGVQAGEQVRGLCRWIEEHLPNFLHAQGVYDSRS
jgi:DNA-binding HxlR family transcriptional regulator